MLIKSYLELYSSYKKYFILFWNVQEVLVLNICLEICYACAKYVCIEQYI